MLYEYGGKAAAKGLARYDKEAKVIYLGDFHQTREQINSETGVRGRYTISLKSQMSSPSEIVQWLAHLSEKVWFTPEMLAAFWAVLDDALSDNGFNSHELPNKLKWPD